MKKLFTKFTSTLLLILCAAVLAKAQNVDETFEGYWSTDVTNSPNPGTYGPFVYSSDGNIETLISPNALDLGSASQASYLSIKRSNSSDFQFVGFTADLDVNTWPSGLTISVTGYKSGSAVTSTIPETIHGNPTNFDFSGTAGFNDVDEVRITGTLQNVFLEGWIYNLSVSTSISSLTKADASPTNAATVNYTATFGSAITGLTASNFSITADPAVTGATVGTPTTGDGGTTWTVPVNTGTGDGSIQLNLANATGLSMAITTSLPFAGDTYSIDKTAPSVSISAPSVNITKAGPVSYTVTYTDANFNSSTLAPIDIFPNVTSTGTADYSNIEVTGTGNTRTVTFEDIIGDGTLSFSLLAGTATDLAGNPADASAASQTFTVDNTAPTANTLVFSSNHPGNQLIADAGDIISLSFSASEAIQAPTVTIGGHTVTASNTSGNDWVASYTMTAADPDGRIAFNLQFNDLAGNSALGYNDVAAGDDIEFLNTAAGLINLTINHNAAFTAAYNPAQVSYTSNVPYSTNEISLTPACDTTATVTVNGIAVSSGTKSQKFPLAVGANTLTVVVTAHDGVTTSTYIVTVNRAASPNAYLSNLKINGGLISLSPSFNYLTNTYTATATISAIRITPATADPGATVTVNTVTVNSGAASNPIALNPGDNTITTLVTAPDGTSTNTYTITVTRTLAPNADLKNLKVNNGSVTLSPAFNFQTTSYTANVPNTTASVRIIAATHDGSATVTVNSAAVTGGMASAPIALGVGDNTITTVVTAADGTTTKTYTITVHRADVGPMAAPYQALAVENPGNSPQLADDGLAVHQGLSPNGDGMNDVLTIDGITNYPDNKLMIVDRSGQLVYEAKGYDNASKVFDGRSNKTGAKQLPGTYFYSLNYNVKGVTKHRTGFIILKY